MSFQWRRGETEIDAMIANVNRRMSMLERELRVNKSTEWTWSKVKPCDPCELAEQINRQMREAMNLLRQNTDATYTWRTIEYEDDLTDFHNRFNRAMRRLQWAVNTASASTTFTLEMDLAGFITAEDDTASGRAWAQLRSLDSASTRSFSGEPEILPGVFANNNEFITEATESDVADWFGIFRSWGRFDTSSVTGTVDSGTFKFRVASVDKEIGLSFALYAYTPGVTLPTDDNNASNDALWSDILSGSSGLASDTTFNTADISVDEDLEFPLNATGLAHIDQNDSTVFALLLVDDFDNNDPGSTAAELLDGVASYEHDDATPANRPTLEITTS